MPRELINRVESLLVVTDRLGVERIGFQDLNDIRACSSRVREVLFESGQS